MNSLAPSSTAKSRLMKLSSAAKLGTCTAASGSAGLLEPGRKDKTAVMGMLERGGKIRASVVPSRRKSVLQEQVHKHVTAGAALYSDALLSYDGLAHQVVDHATQYVDGRVHTNGLEISGRFSSAGCREPTLAWSRFTFTATLISKCSDSITGKTLMMLAVLSSQSLRLSGSGSRSPN